MEGKRKRKEEKEGDSAGKGTAYKFQKCSHDIFDV